MSNPSMTYEELVGMISGVHDSDKVRSAYKKIARHLYLSRPDLIDDLIQIEQAHEKVNRQTFGLKAKADGLAKDKEELKRRLYNRRNR